MTIAVKCSHLESVTLDVVVLEPELIRQNWTENTFLFLQNHKDKVVVVVVVVLRVQPDDTMTT